jgi:MFS family permease
MLIASRVLVGAACGAGSVVTPMYLGEIATEATRGAFGALFQLQITVFILIVQLASMPGALSSSGSWGYLFAVSAVLAALGLAAAPFMLESPKWLVKQGRRDHAQSTLAQLRDVTQAEAAEDLLHLEGEDDSVEDVEAAAAGGVRKEQAGVMSLGAVLGDSYLRTPLLILAVLMLTQQFSGINAVFYYSTSFFKVREGSGAPARPRFPPPPH